MIIKKEIDMTVDVDLNDQDIDEWMRERIGDVDILMTDEAKEKMKAIKAKYYEKWMELYWFFENPQFELQGKDVMSPGMREDARNYFL